MSDLFGNHIVGFSTRWLKCRLRSTFRKDWGALIIVDDRFVRNKEKYCKSRSCLFWNIFIKGERRGSVWGGGGGSILQVVSLSKALIAHCTGPEVIKLFSCSAQLRLKFILLINVKMPTIVGIFTFISSINYRLWSFKPSMTIYLGYFSICEDLKFQAQLS